VNNEPIGRKSNKNPRPDQRLSVNWLQRLGVTVSYKSVFVQMR